MSPVDLKEIEDVDASDDQQQSDAEQLEKDAVAPEENDDFGYRSEGKRSFLSGAKSSVSSNKATVAITGILGLIVVFVVIAMVLVSQLKVIHFGELLTATGYARFNGIMQERTTQDIFDASVVEGDGTAQLRGKSLVDRIKMRNVETQIADLGRQNKLRMEFDGERLNKVTFEGGEVSLNELSKKFGKENFESLSVREKMTVRSEFAKSIKASVGENLALEPRYIQGRTFKLIADNVGFKFSRWRNAGRDLLGKKRVEAIVEDTSNSVKEISQDGTESGNKVIDDAAKEYKNEERIKANIEKNGGKFDKVAFQEAVNVDIAKATKLQEVAGTISIGTMVMSIACMANQTFANIDDIAEQNETSATLMGLQLPAAMDQIKSGNVTSEAYQTADAQLSGAENSAAYRYQTGKAINYETAEQPRVTPTIDPTFVELISKLTSPTQSSGLGALASQIPELKENLDEVDKKFCDFLLSPQGMVAFAGAEFAVQVVAAFLSAGGSEALAQGAGRAAATIMVQSLEKALFSTVKGVVSFKSAGTLLAFGAYGVALQYVAMSFSGSTFSGAEQGAGYYDRNSVGTNVLQNRQIRSQYGRPIDTKVAKGLDTQYVASIKEKWNGKGFSERYFAIENPYSLVGAASVYAPGNLTSGLQLVRRGLSNMGALLKPLSVIKGVATLGASNKVYAAEAEDYDPYGGEVQWGFSNDELEKMRNDESYTITENEKHISPEKISALDSEIGSCFDAGRSQYSVNKDPKCSAERLSRDDAFRYRIYKLDSSIVAMTEEDLSKPSSSTITSSSPAGAGEDAIGYDNGVQKNIKIVTVNDSEGKPIVKVNSEIADNVKKLYEAAKQAGVPMSAKSSFRTMEEQEYFWNCYQTKSCNNGNEAAKPGYSNHQKGYAVDFSCIGHGSFAGTPCFAWMQQHAAEFGLKNLPSKAWHWSRDGG